MNVFSYLLQKNVYRYFLKTAQYRCQHGTISPHHIQLYLTTVYLKSNPLIPITYWFPDNAKSLVKNLQPSPWTSTYSHFTDTWVFAKSSNEIYMDQESWALFINQLLSSTLMDGHYVTHLTFGEIKNSMIRFVCEDIKVHRQYECCPSLFYILLFC